MFSVLCWCINTKVNKAKPNNVLSFFSHILIAIVNLTVLKFIKRGMASLPVSLGEGVAFCAVSQINILKCYQCHIISHQYSS